jgi:hypothetical protein
LYNNYVIQENEKITVSRKAEVKLTNERQKIKPVEATFGIYELFKVKNYETEMELYN